MQNKLYFLVPFFMFFLIAESLLAQSYFELNYNQSSELKISELGDLSISVGESIQLGGNNLISGGKEPYFIQWEPSLDLDFNDIIDPIASPEITTTYVLTVVDDNGCELVANQTVMVNQITGLNHFSKETIFKLYPNPSKGVFICELSNLGDQSDFIISVLNVTGQEVFKEKISPMSYSFRGHIDLSHAPRGSYIAKIQLAQHCFVQLICIQ